MNNKMYANYADLLRERKCKIEHLHKIILREANMHIRTCSNV